METIINIEFESKEQAEEVKQGLMGETTFQGRATASIEAKEKVLSVKITGPDLAALHATTGSYFRALKIILAVQEQD